MRAINVIGAFIVLIANLTVSYNHSIQLFQAGGFAGVLSHIAVIGIETTFVLGALNIVTSRMRGEPPGSPAIMGGLLGAGLVSWSNVSAGWEYGITGILLGLTTPASLIVAEAILSHAILQASQKREESLESEERGVDISPTPSPTPPSMAGEDLETPPDEWADSPGMLENVGENLENSPDAWETATRLWEEAGELPSRRVLMKEANCSEWEARKVLAELRKQEKTG